MDEGKNNFKIVYNNFYHLTNYYKPSQCDI
jgi:hypothetical protein